MFVFSWFDLRSALFAVLGCLIVNVSFPITPFGESAYAGSVRLGGARLNCAGTRIVTNSAVSGMGYAKPGTIILNMRRLRRQPAAVQRIVFLHECAHQYVGADESAADCWAVKAAKRRGWLSRSGINQVCRAIRNTSGGLTHASGGARCVAMKACYAGMKKKRRGVRYSKRRNRHRSGQTRGFRADQTQTALGVPTTRN